jgi:lipoprotein-anchoring transpeptidase ErfK/SrfK
MTRILSTLLLLTAVALTGCVQQQTNSNSNSNSVATGPSPASSPSPTTVAEVKKDDASIPVTMPVLDAFFADEEFAKDLKSKLSLNDDQIEKLRATAREETAKLRETAGEDQSGSTADARELASQRIKEIIGDAKATEFFTFVRDRWQGGIEANEKTPATNTAALPTKPNSVPTDTRVVVNSPAYRMDVFENGQLVKSYKVGIGYPEFPLPTGMRKAKTIIFNPTWTPPDEPWVESASSKVKVGQKVEAGSKLNPLGVLKIPIGLPSLIHGGKSPAKLGTFASHGCVGLTDPLAQDFAKLLARIGGANLTDAQLAEFKRNRSETKSVSLSTTVPVELRYETIVAEDGKLHIYRDVYDRDTNTEENLRAVLEAYGVRLEDLTEDERTQVMEALDQMSRDARGRATPAPSASPKKPTTGKVTRTIKGKKEIVIEIAALKGKGYPAMTGAKKETVAAAKPTPEKK